MYIIYYRACSNIIDYEKKTYIVLNLACDLNKEALEALKILYICIYHLTRTLQPVSKMHVIITS